MLNRIAFAPVLVFLALLAGIVSTGVAEALEPIYSVLDHPVPVAAQSLSVDEIRRAIIAAGSQRQWRFESVGPGALTATYEARGHAATVKVAYSQKAYSITLVSTYNLGQEGGQINRHYNNWVRNLEKDIELGLTAHALAR